MKRRRALLFTLSVVLALCAASGWWLHRERQQYALNRQLIDALEHDDIAMALALVNAGADPNTHEAATPPPSFKLLLDHLLHPASPLNKSPTAFMFACGIRWNPTTGLPIPPVRLEENWPLVQAMLVHGATVKANPAHTRRRTILHYGVVMARWQIVELLLQQGADINAQEEQGETPLIYAAWSEKPTQMRLLLRYGANPNVQSDDGSTVLHKFIPTIQDNDTDLSLLRELLVHGARPDVKNNVGVTPLQLAQTRRRPDIIALLTHGAR